MTDRETQPALPLPVRGGRRPGAGRKPTGPVAGASHARRTSLSRHHPVHVTVRVLPHVWNLRSARGMAVVEAALLGARARPGFRVTHVSVQGNHVHLVAEARDGKALASGMKAFSIRLAKGMNRLMGRRGPVLQDRYHAHVLRTPAEVRRAVEYVTGNFESHARRRGDPVDEGFRDRFGSKERPELVDAAESWLGRRVGRSASR